MSNSRNMAQKSVEGELSCLMEAFSTSTGDAELVF